MTTGALIFAFDNEQTDYVAMAGWSAENIHRHLDIPVAVVTNAPDRARTYSGIDRVIEAVPASGGEPVILRIIKVLLHGTTLVVWTPTRFRRGNGLWY